MVTILTSNSIVLTKKSKETLQFGQSDFQKERIFTIDVSTALQSCVKTWVVSLVLYTYLVKYSTSYSPARIPQLTTLLITIELATMIVTTKTHQEISQEKKNGYKRLSHLVFRSVRRS